MKIALILPDVDSFHALRIHFGLAYLSTALKAAGYRDVRFWAVTSVPDYARVLAELKDYRPDIAAFTSVETQFENVIALSREIKAALPCVTVCGGTFATLFPDCIKDAPGLDGIFRGECEDAFVRFVRRVERKEDLRQAENFCWHDRESGKVAQNPLLPLETDLDRHGFADKTIFDYQSVIDGYDGYAPFMFNRGCPYDCAFCSNHALAMVYSQSRNLTRRRSVDSCVAEIRDAAAGFSFRGIHIWDDLFTSNRRWLYEFLDRYKAEIAKPFMCTTRSNECDDELFRRLKEAGCYKVHMSLESGSDFIRNRIMRRGISREKVESSFQSAHRHGIRVSASSIIGLPFETEDMVKETIALLGKLRIADLGVNVFYPYRGTRLRELCEQYGLIGREVKYGLRERRESVLDSPHMSKEKLAYYRDNFAVLARRHQGLMEYAWALINRHLRPLARRLLKGRKAR